MPVVDAQANASPDVVAAVLEVRDVLLTFENETTIISWSTNVPATSSVDFGFDIRLSNNSNDTVLKTGHSVILKTVQGTRYFYRVSSCDASGACKSMPVGTFFAGRLFVDADLPRFVRSNNIDIPGRTRPGALVAISVNGIEIRKGKIEKSDFIFRSVQLGKVSNNVSVSATLGNESVQRLYVVDVDDAPPRLNVSVSPTATVSTFTANVTVSEPVNLSVEVKPSGAQPLRVGDLKSTEITTEKVKLTWSKVSDALEYGVYRDDKRIAVVNTNEFTDSAVSAGKQYQYQVSGVSEQCVEGDKSDVATATIPTGTARQDVVQEARFSCERPKQELVLAAGKSSVPVQLRVGENLITFTVVDKAGFVTSVEERVLFDTGAPSFKEHNLRQLSPVYFDVMQRQETLVKGRLSEPGSVTLFVNGKPQKTVLTAADGSFSMPLKLERKANLSTKPRISGESGIKFPNKVRLEASDAVGFTAKTEEVDVDLQQCGVGSKINVELSKPLPEILNPRLLVQGVQTLGFSFKYKYQGGQDGRVDKNQIKLTRVTLSPEVQKEFDNGLVSVDSRPIGVRSTARGKKGEGQGYIQIRFQPIEDPWSQLKESKPKVKDGVEEEMPNNATSLMKQQRIGDHRKGDCLVPGFGCMKLFFELEIPFQETRAKGPADPLVRRTPEEIKTETEFQKTCVQIEVPIDIVIPPKYIPKGLLQATSELLTAIVTGIDKVLKPIETIGKYLTYTCLAGQAISFIPIFLEKYNCEFSATVQGIGAAAGGGSGKFDPNVAAAGACDAQYDPNKDDTKEANSNCHSCRKSKVARKVIEYTYRQVCDRVMCPAAPSLQYYLKTSGQQKLTPIASIQNDGEWKKRFPNAYGGQKGDQFFVGNDCAAWVEKNKRKVQAGARTPPRLFFTYNEIKGIYSEWLNHKSDKWEGEPTGGAPNCNGLHPASPDCCGFAYMDEWASACGVGGVTVPAIDTFDEIKESTCLSAEKANQPGIPGAAAGQVEECNSKLNAVGGFCEPDGSEPPTTIQVRPLGGAGAAGPVAGSELERLSVGREKYLYIVLLPQKAQTAGATTGEYTIRLGYIAESIELERPQPGKLAITQNRHRIGSTQMEVVEIDGSEDLQTKYFSQENIDKYNSNPESLTTLYTEFGTRLCQSAVTGGTAVTPCPVAGKEMYDQVMAVIGSPDKEYIIKPNEGLVNSLRCICIPTLLAFLKRWRNILAAVRNCMNTILLTGDGQSGICQAVVSQHACDLLYDAIACFTQKFSTGRGRTLQAGAGVGNVMGALTSAGSEMSRSVESRYGETSLYKQIFVDRKLVHSVCLFAFTGTWNFDVGAAFDAAVDTVPTKSNGLLYPCTRRFVSFNPASKPAGLVTWQYQFGWGFAAGSDIEGIELVLKCSGGFKCRESDGFIRGKCDCDAPRETVISPDGLSGRLKNGAVENGEVFELMEGGPEGNIRYDKAFLRWRWNDGKKTIEDKTDECTINLDGGGGSIPGECKFDPLALAFRCSLAGDTGGIQFVETKVNAPRQILVKR